MELPTLEELKKILAEKEYPAPFKPSSVWTRTDALSIKLNTILFLELEEIKKGLCVKRATVNKISFFPKKYMSNPHFNLEKITDKRRGELARDIYRVSEALFSARDLRQMVRDINEIISASNDVWGRVLWVWRPLDEFSKRIDELFAFWELNSQSEGEFLDGIFYEINHLKKSIVCVSRFINKRGV